ncbi:MAG: enoyl-[acyl-carrier-protein] reductase [Herpetosiphonaceae bacterium]|nr:MAG: enoyl-[acyl-carrier-protein] reductase [Herpetosiphonaceae bacterium]
MTLEGNIALVTGGSRGIGRAISLKLAAEGADIIINFFRNRGPAEETAQEIERLGRRAYVIKANLGDPEKIDDLFRQLREQTGGLDILIANAASGFLRPALQQDARGWDWTLNINARSLLLLAKQAAPLMAERGGGSIVAISSLGSQRVMANYVAVGASKAALEAIVRYLAVELAPQGIVVNAVSGGLVETEALEHFPNREEMLRAGRELTPAGRLVTPEDIAGVVHFLCTPVASMIRGQTIIVDGGYSLPAM